MIELSSIYLKNWMSIEELSLDFSNNTITAITGENGAGKSALIYAVAFALTGYRKGESYKDYVKVGSDFAQVNLTGFLKGNRITYSIEIPANKKSGTVKREVVYKGQVYLNSDYNQFVKEHDLDFLENIMFLFQGSTDIINAKPSERAQLLKKLFQFDFTPILERFKEQQETLNIKNVENTALLNELSSRVFESMPLIRTLTPQAIEVKKQKLAHILDDISSIKNVDEENFIKYEKWLNSLDSDINKEETKLNKTKSQLDDARAQLFPLEEPIGVQEAIDELNIQLGNLEKSSVEATLKLNASNEELKIKNHIYSELEGQIKISKTGICHACGHEISEEHIKSLEEKFLSCKEELSTVKEVNKVLKKNLSDISAEIRKTKDDITANEYTLRGYATMKNTLSSINNKIMLYENDLKNSESVLERLRADRERVLVEKEAIDKLKPVYERKQTLNKEYNKLSEEISVAEKNILINSERASHNNDILKEKVARDNKVKELSTICNDTTIELTDVKTAISIFDNLFPNYIIVQACERLEDFINSIIYKVFPNMRVSLELSRSGVTFMYTLDGEDPIPVSMASGAQKTILALAYQIALAKMYGLSCIFLDEADAAMSDENSKVVYEFILSLEDFTQIFFISHRKESLNVLGRASRDNITLYYVNNGIFTEK